VSETGVTEHAAALQAKIRRLQGPILVLGASGFVGANLLRAIAPVRDDVFGTAMHTPAWRLAGLASRSVLPVDLLVESSLVGLLDEVRPRTVFNCVAYGAYSFERDSDLIYRTNFTLTADIVHLLADRDIACYVHAGSSSEYGENAAAPREDATLRPNSDYAVSKVACSELLGYMGAHRGLPCANLRLYSVYGPLEDSSRLIPAVIREGLQGRYPPLVDPSISRDFVFTEDVCDAFVTTALELREEDYGASFNIGTGRCTTIGDVAGHAGRLFELGQAPTFEMPARRWDVTDWYANVDKAAERLGWRPSTGFEQGLARTVDWYQSLDDPERYLRASKQHQPDAEYSISAIVACYRDAQAIPIMYERLRATFEKLDVDHEIIFVNDGSPDDSEEVIRGISRSDRRVVGISHSRNFGSQAAFRSGMEIASKRACVLLDGDLQDPPEVIEEFVARWREGYEVVYGRRVKREAPLFMQGAYKAFYWLFDRFSYLSIPRDAGDFALVQRNVMEQMLRFPERDLFLRGVRAFVGFRQTGVDYVRPERMFGRTTNSLRRNLGWAKKGILSFSNVPLSMLSALGVLLLGLSLVLGLVEIAARVFFPGSAPKGFTTVLLIVLFFGSINLFAVGMIGEYVGRIFDEVKQRPLFIRRSIIRDGEVRPAADVIGAAPAPPGQQSRTG
jgi:dolichol-phosphate mannosyltransferase